MSIGELSWLDVFSTCDEEAAGPVTFAAIPGERVLQFLLGCLIRRNFRFSLWRMLPL